MPAEQSLDLENIQGGIFPGFTNPTRPYDLHEALFFLKITNVGLCKQWVRALVTPIVTAAQVYEQRSKDHSVWKNIGFSYNALKLLLGAAVDFQDNAFKRGIATRSVDLGDPIEPEAEGHPTNWVIGGPHNEADIILIVAHEEKEVACGEANRIEGSLYRSYVNGEKLSGSGVQLLFKQSGAKLKKGQEHFGFHDGNSQPGLRCLPPKYNNDPGHDPLWPGEFIFGYPRQHPDDPENVGELADAGPSWAKDGSLLVFRRLRQDVASFRQLLALSVKHLAKSQVQGITEDDIGAKLVGRWQTGVPLSMEMSAEMPEQKKNDFNFIGDPEGRIWPLASHVRKMNPRDDEFLGPGGEAVNRATARTHRLLRRGIPYGPSFQDDKSLVDRGLLFLAYQTSIERQFEYITKNWANNPHLKGSNSGYDPLIGQNNRPGSFRERSFSCFWQNNDEKEQILTLKKDLVIPTGGGYFFVPSISALEILMTRKAGDESNIGTPSRGRVVSPWR